MLVAREECGDIDFYLDHYHDALSGLGHRDPLDYPHSKLDHRRRLSWDHEHVFDFGNLFERELVVVLVVVPGSELGLL